MLKEQELQKQKQEEQLKQQQQQVKSSAQNTSAKSSPQSTTVLNTPPLTEQFNAAPPSAPIVTPASKQSSPTQSLTDEQKRLQAIQEMKEQEKRKREEIAGKIDMNEQHALMFEFEQNIYKY